MKLSILSVAALAGYVSASPYIHPHIPYLLPASARDQVLQYAKDYGGYAFCNQYYCRLTYFDGVNWGDKEPYALEY
ncbi:hypothetical protein CJU89_6030 [Yarrowia sp. B02]|nr:hypothetical protein CJU89_6030 [Yarrowia sp. B02]